jgi:hypothetical protein
MKGRQCRLPFKDYYNNDLMIGKGLQTLMINSNELIKCEVMI